ncbi:NADH-dependent flavin oxidoreductase [Phlyctema vagabunda]|uniref:NADH-dependent flavin oxidoreductase n=1 Tax=Phlyctema vagabunda TaxID=108571 RepID=A0ABR4PB64_9HELO
MADHNCPTTKIHKPVDEDSRVPVVEPKARIEADHRLQNTAAPDASTAIVHPDQEIPKLFQPVNLRSLRLQNRIVVSPMCQYSADNGHPTPWQFAHLGGIIQRGPGLTITEATAVAPEGRITPQDAGLWLDSQMGPWKQIVEFTHSQNQHIAVQLAHAGRKASTVAPWVDRKAAAPVETGGWPDKVVSSSDIPYDEHTCIPTTMTLRDIASLKQSFADAVGRALKIGFDAIEIHAAHGYLLHSSLTAATNKLPAPYSGSLENRMRLTIEIVALVRSLIPSTMPLLIRIPGSDWVDSPDAWDVKQAVELAKALSAPELGVDFLDVSSGGLLSQQKIKSGPSYQAPFSKAVKEAVKDTGILVGAVGMITQGEQAEGLLQDGYADIILAARAFQKHPGLVWQWADELNVEVRVANQIGWGFGQRPNGGVKGHAGAARG